MEFTVLSRSPADTRQWGRLVGERVKAGDFIALVGQMGSGKTVFAQGVLEGLGIARPGGSPTFTLLWEYEGRLPVYHFDLYRMEAPEAELAGLGFEEYFYGCGICLVEWADRAPALWPPHHLRVDLKVSGEGRRVLRFSARSRRGNALVKGMRDAGLGA